MVEKRHLFKMMFKLKNFVFNAHAKMHRPWILMKLEGTYHWALSDLQSKLYTARHIFRFSSNVYLHFSFPFQGINIYIIIFYQK